MNVLCVCSAALGLDPEQPEYDLDSEDEMLLGRLNRKMEIKPVQFETMVDRLEKASTHQVRSHGRQARPLGDITARRRAGPHSHRFLGSGSACSWFLCPRPSFCSTRMTTC